MSQPGSSRTEVTRLVRDPNLVKGVGAHATEKKQAARKLRKQPLKDARLEKDTSYLFCNQLMGEAGVKAVFTDNVPADAGKGSLVRGFFG